MIVVTCDFTDKHTLSGLNPGKMWEIVTQCLQEWEITPGNDNYVLAVIDVSGVRHILPTYEDIKWGQFTMLCIGGTV